ncbi:MAG: carboxypeptidase-like regulatory domain-containing protein [Acidobacteriota bacterium]
MRNSQAANCWQRLIGTSIVLVLCWPITRDAASAEERAFLGGRVLTLWGQPVSDAKVSVQRIPNLPGAHSIDQTTWTKVTDPSGNYEFEELPWGHYRVKVTAADFCCTELAAVYIAAGGRRTVDLGLPLALTHGLSHIILTGRVRDTDRKAIAGATVTLLSPFDLGRWEQVRSDDHGRYMFRLVQPGQYLLLASKPGFLSASAAIDAGVADTLTTSLELRIGKPKGIR